MTSYTVITEFFSIEKYYPQITKISNSNVRAFKAKKT